MSAVTDFVRITDNGVDSFLSVDADGAGTGSGFVWIGIMQNAIGLTNEVAMEANNNIIMA